MKSVLKLPVRHFSYVNLVTEGALIIFFPEKKRQGALIGAGVLNGANTVLLMVLPYKDLHLNIFHFTLISFNTNALPYKDFPLHSHFSYY